MFKKFWSEDQEGSTLSLFKKEGYSPFYLKTEDIHTIYIKDEKIWISWGTKSSTQIKTSLIEKMQITPGMAFEDLLVEFLNGSTNYVDTLYLYDEKKNMERRVQRIVSEKVNPLKEAFRKLDRIGIDQKAQKLAKEKLKPLKESLKNLEASFS